MSETWDAWDVDPLLDVEPVIPTRVDEVAAALPADSIQLRRPPFVSEVLLVVVVGPEVLDLVSNEGSLRTMSALGLLGWLLSIPLALTLTYAL
jgi:hypothetical protein